MAHPIINPSPGPGAPSNVVAMWPKGASLRLSLLAAERASRIRVFDMLPETPRIALARFTETSGIARPSVIIAGDDDGRQRGPQAFVALRLAMRWARFCFIHADLPTRQHFDVILEAADRHKRLLLVEATTATWRDWRQCWGDRAGAMVIPSGHLHPLPPRGAA